MPFYLDEILRRRAIAAEHDCRTGYAFTPDNPYFNPLVLGAERDERRETAFEEINVIDALVRLLQKVLYWELDGLQAPLQQSAIVARHPRQQMILGNRFGESGH